MALRGEGEGGDSETPDSRCRSRPSAVRGARGAPSPRKALECEELCKVSCMNSWRLLTACYEPSWGCPVGCARACQEGGQKDTCEVACGVQFEGKRCDLASCQWGCRRGLQLLRQARRHQKLAKAVESSQTSLSVFIRILSLSLSLYRFL